MATELEALRQLGAPAWIVIGVAALVFGGMLVWICIVQHRLNNEDKRRQEDWDRYCEGMERWRKHYDDSLDYLHASQRRMRERLGTIERRLDIEPKPAPPADSEEEAAFQRFKTLETKLGLTPNDAQPAPQEDKSTTN